jgi:UDP-glucose:(glucosyl)LPS alpha-1,2-glucosyltransferase
MELNEISSKAMGGTELMLHGLYKHVPGDLLEHFQIIPSRVRDIDTSKIKVLWLHDLPNDPESEHLKNGGYNLFDKLVFVSNWQMQAYISHYGIPWHKCVVIHNAIEPVEVDWTKKYNDKIKLIYHTTPHRGLNILVGVFDKLSQEYNNIELDVYSSFKIYGWEERDEQYKEVFDFCKQHPKINYMGTVSNAEVKQALANADIFAYPSIWLETSCISLMEAMSAGLVCVHPNYGALFETAANWTFMYQYNQTHRDHVQVFYGAMKGAIDQYISAPYDQTLLALKGQKSYTDLMYSWAGRQDQWTAVLASLLYEHKRIKY